MMKTRRKLRLFKTHLAPHQEMRGRGGDELKIAAIFLVIGGEYESDILGFRTKRRQLLAPSGTKNTRNGKVDVNEIINLLDVVNFCHGHGLQCGDFTCNTRLTSIIILYGQGLSHSETARLIDVLTHALALWIRRFEDTGATINCHPRCTTPEQERVMAAVIHTGRCATTVSIRKQHGIRFTPKTIRNRLYSMVLHGRIPANKLQLTELKMEKRL
ncbi:hypothetical protein Hamer_G013915 [Homarus americanus]|uniref:Uncharacterized protein n=1 Tax=Homarus americanus TaxID=6706 RepID=A0A8J5N1D6_HOMAM|nr:hypothetical protein Hamer_G013915 [Homarus americanus]